MYRITSRSHDPNYVYPGIVVPCEFEEFADSLDGLNTRSVRKGEEPTEFATVSEAAQELMRGALRQADRFGVQTAWENIELWDMVIIDNDGKLV